MSGRNVLACAAAALTVAVACSGSDSAERPNDQATTEVIESATNAPGLAAPTSAADEVELTAADGEPPSRPTEVWLPGSLADNDETLSQLEWDDYVSGASDLGKDVLAVLPDRANAEAAGQVVCTVAQMKLEAGGGPGTYGLVSRLLDSLGHPDPDDTAAVVLGAAYRMCNDRLVLVDNEWGSYDEVDGLADRGDCRALGRRLDAELADPAETDTPGEVRQQRLVTYLDELLAFSDCPRNGE